MKKLVETMKQADINAPSLALWFQSGDKRVFRFEVPGAGAIATWHKLRNVVSELHYWPVVLGCEEEVETASRCRDLDSHSPEEVLRESIEIDAEKWFATWQERQNEKTRAMVEYLKSTPGNEGMVEILESTIVKPEGDWDDPKRFSHGPWPEEVLANHRFEIPIEFDPETAERRFHSKICLGLVETTNSWEVPAILAFGGFNACPFPHEHAGISRYWWNRYGAEVVGVTHDAIEMLVARPPQTREEAIRLATQHTIYSEEATGTLEAVAASLWHFWWD